MKIFIASDHAGLKLKEQLKNLRKDAEWIDLGTDSESSVDYPEYADKCAAAMKHESQAFGVLICGSGVGISIAANRHTHIRAVLAESETVAKLGREHNHANILCLGSRIVDEKKALSILNSFLTATPDLGERHQRRIQKLSTKVTV